MESSSVSPSWQEQDDEKLKNRQAILPGFRFHPTDKELVSFYLRRKLHNSQTNFYNLILDLDLYSYEPWDLPGLAAVGEVGQKWSGSSSFLLQADCITMDHWKATGTEKPVYSHPPDYHLLGWKKTLVFYKGRAPVGHKTDRITNEYRFHHTNEAEEKEADIRVCRVYKKASLARSFDRRLTIHVERQLQTGYSSPLEYKASISTQVETNSSQQHCRGLGQQSSHSMNEGAGKPYSLPKTEMEVELEELRHSNLFESLWCCNNALTVEDVEVETSSLLSPMWHYSP